MSNVDQAITTTRGQSSTSLVRTGRLAGRAVVAAWVVSAIYHVVLFGGMYAQPWLASMVADHRDVPAPLTGVIEQTTGPSITLAPSPELATPRELTTLEPLEFEPTQFEPISPTLSDDAKRLEIIGIGTGGADFDGHGLRVSSATAGPQFFGLGGEVRGIRNVVYVVDRSGSMLTTFQGVVTELTDSVGRLRRTQKFHVIFFNAGMPLENPPRRLVSAIQAHKRELLRFLQGISPMGRTDPRPAMERAFAVEPDLIYFLTDGDFDPVLLKSLDRLNRNRRVRIYTVAYANPWGRELLERIAREHNGQFRFVSEEEIFQP